MTSGEGQTAFRDLPFAARDAVRKCSKSQVAVIARLRRPTITADASTSTAAAAALAADAADAAAAASATRADSAAATACGDPSLVTEGPPSLVTGDPSLVTEGPPSLVTGDPSLVTEGPPSLVTEGPPSLVTGDPSLVTEGPPSLVTEPPTLYVARYANCPGPPCMQALTTAPPLVHTGTRTASAVTPSSTCMRRSSFWRIRRSSRRSMASMAPSTPN